MKQTQGFQTFKQRKDTFLRRGRYRWPYIKDTSYLAQPDTLASAGFSFSPAKDAPDNVQCFHCGFELTGWEPTDDPFSEHFAHQPSCIYAKLHCQTRSSQTGNKVEWTGWPLGDGAEATAEQRKKLLAIREDVGMRLATFESNEWPHNGRKDWNVTPEKLAKAGFYYTPEWTGDDTATCLFCGYALGEWEAEDDPNAEHERRVPECLFFTLAKNTGAALVSSPVPKGTPRRVSLRRSIQPVTVGDLEEHGGETSSPKRQRVSNVEGDDGVAEENGDEDVQMDADHSDGNEHDSDEAALQQNTEGDDTAEEQEQEGEEGDGMGEEEVDAGEQGTEHQANADHGVQDQIYEDQADEDAADYESEHEQPADDGEIGDEEDHHELQEESDGGREQEHPEEDDGAVEHDEGEAGEAIAESATDAQWRQTADATRPRGGVHVGPDTSVGADASDYSDNERSGGASGDEMGEETQLSNTQVEAGEGEMASDMMVDDDYQQSTQVGSGDGSSWELTEEEESMSVEEFIRACCEQKVVSLEASAAQMISSFMQRAESTRERIYNMPW
ncbi:hypothetical protein GGI07_001405 [Coemansia sp. Benny D115]|nr:hypothetical protein GGI07_001405 [Coemansia sp. Benny D115]